EATHVRGEQSPEVLDLRMSYLLECLESLRASTHLFRNADADVVHNAVTAAGSLARIDRSANLNLLPTAPRPPEDPATRAEVERLRARLADVRALLHVGHYHAGLQAVLKVAEEVSRV